MRWKALRIPLFASGKRFRRKWEANAYVVENITFTPEVEVRNCEFREIPTRGVLVTSRKPIVIENNAFCKLSMAPIYISCDANNWYESGRVGDVLIRNNKFYNCQGDGVIFIDPVIEKASRKERYIKISGLKKMRSIILKKKLGIIRPEGLQECPDQREQGKSDLR